MMIKDIMDVVFIKEMVKIILNLYWLGWDERNGGNIIYLLDEKEVVEYLDVK